jgi:hypothetical protein
MDIIDWMEYKTHLNIKDAVGINLESWNLNQPERLSPETAQADAIVRPVDINKTTEASRND